MLKQLGIERIFSAPYHLQSNGKLEVFHKYLKPTLKKLSEKDQSNQGYIHLSGSCQLPSDTKLCHSRITFLPSLWKRSKFTPTPASRAYATILGDPDSALLNLEAHRLALALAKKTLDENCFRTAQKTMDQQPPSFKIGDRVYFKNKQPGKWYLKWRPGYRIDQIKHDGHILHIKKPSYQKSTFLQCKGCST